MHAGVYASGEASLSRRVQLATDGKQHKLSAMKYVTASAQAGYAAALRFDQGCVSWLVDLAAKCWDQFQELARSLTIYVRPRSVRGTSTASDTQAAGKPAAAATAIPAAAVAAPQDLARLPSLAAAVTHGSGQGLGQPPLVRRLQMQQQGVPGSGAAAASTLTGGHGMEDQESLLGAKRHGYDFVAAHTTWRPYYAMMRCVDDSTRIWHSALRTCMEVEVCNASLHGRLRLAVVTARISNVLPSTV